MAAGRSFAGQELVQEPTPTPGKADHFEVLTDKMQATVHKEILESHGGGRRVSFIMPELPWLKRKRKRASRPK